MVLTARRTRRVPRRVPLRRARHSAQRLPRSGARRCSWFHLRKKPLTDLSPHPAPLGSGTAQPVRRRDSRLGSFLLGRDGFVGPGQLCRQTSRMPSGAAVLCCRCRIGAKRAVRRPAPASELKDGAVMYTSFRNAALCVDMPRFGNIVLLRSCRCMRGNIGAVDETSSGTECASYVGLIHRTMSDPAAVFRAGFSIPR